MLITSEVLRSLFGALILARFDCRGLKYLDNTITSFWRSFIAAVIIFPLFLILVSIRFDTLSLNSGAIRYFSLDICAYFISWLAFPLLIDKLSYSIGRERRFLRFMVAYNWSMVPQNILYTIIIILSYMELLSDNVTNTLILLILMWTFAFTWFVAREALEISTLGAIGIVMIDFLLSLMIEATITSRH